MFRSDTPGLNRDEAHSLKQQIAIKTISFEQPIPINMEQLLAYYCATGDLTIRSEEDHGYIYQIKNKLFTLQIKDNAISAFQSAHTLADFRKEINELPMHHAELKSQLQSLHTMLKQKMVHHFKLEKEESKRLSEKSDYFNEFYQQAGCFDTLPKLNISELVSSDALDKAMVIPEHAYAVLKVGVDDLYVGTHCLYTCVSLVGINQQLGLIGLAHLNLRTIATYQQSLQHMFDALQASESSRIQVYLIGGYDGDVLRQGPISKTLVLSLYEFIKQAHADIIATHLLQDDIHEYVLRINLTQHEFLRVHPDDVGILIENSRKLVAKHLLDYAINYMELACLGCPDSDTPRLAYKARFG